MPVKTKTTKILSSLFFFVFAISLIIGACKKKEGDGMLRPEEEEEENIEILSGIISQPIRLENRFTDPLVPDYKVPVSVTFAAKVTIMPGVRIEMGPNAKITVTEHGTIRSMGTADSNVVFTGKQANPGYWDYIIINSYDSVNQFKHTVIEHGGGNIYQPASLILNGTSMMKFHNNIVRHSEGYGIETKTYSCRLLDFYNNSIEDCGMAPIKIFSSQMKFLDNTSILNINNVYNRIEVVGSDVTSVESWPKTNVPFYLTGATTVKSDIVIKPGAHFIFGPAGRILVTETGSIYAAGTETDSIYFRGAHPIQGYWDCILFLSNNPYNQFKYVSLMHGGGYYYWNAAIYLQDAFFRISHSTIAYSARWGIYRNGIYNFENGGFNNFHSNAIGPIGP